MFPLLQPDDTIVLAETETELQDALNVVNDYWNLWFIKVDASKTEVKIFSKVKITKKPTFKFGDTNIVDDYTYLAVTFYYNNIFSKSVNTQVHQTRWALFSMLKKFYNLTVVSLVILRLNCSINLYLEFPEY